MSNSFSGDIEGLADLENALRGLEIAAQKKVMRRAARKGMEPVLAQVKAGVNARWGDKSGALHDSVRLKTSTPKNPNWADVIGSVGIYRIRALESIAKEFYPKGYYITAPVLAYWFEFGTQAHSLAKNSKSSRNRDNGGGRHPGMPAKPVIRPTMDANLEITMARAANVLRTEIDRNVR